MTRRIVELVVRARRLVTPSVSGGTPGRGKRTTARRQVGEELTQFSFRLALVIDLAYVAVGAVGGAAVGRATRLDEGPNGAPAAGCRADSATRPSVARPDDTRPPPDAGLEHPRSGTMTTRDTSVSRVVR